MRPYSVFNIATGEAVAVGDAADQLMNKLHDPATEVIYYDYSGRGNYYDAGTETILPKMDHSITDDIANPVTVGTVVTFQNIPEGSIMNVASVGPVTIDATGVLAITIESIGQYPIQFTHPHYNQYSWTVTCDD